MNIKAPKGTSDIVGEDVVLWQEMENTIRRVCRQYNIQEIRTPIFEDTRLFVRSIGEVTDIVEKEMYTFESKGGDSVTLRPEGTASIVRALLENSLHKKNPLNKLYYMGPMFRYERPQAGRSRQFHQFGVEVSGTYSPWMDAEVIALAHDIYKALGIEGVTIHLNTLGTGECRDRYRAVLKDLIKPKLGEYCEQCQARYERNVFRMLDCKNKSCKALNEGLPTIEDSLSDDAKAHFDTVQEALAARGIDHKVDPSIVRGFDYYNHTVFELKHHSLGAQDAIGGGGRYDNLVSDLGGPEAGSVGFALGLERTIIALKARGEAAAAPSIDYFILAVDDAAKVKGAQILQAQRNKGLSADMDMEGRSFKAQMRMANRLGAKEVLILGEDELARGMAAVKHMESSEQREIALSELLES